MASAEVCFLNENYSTSQKQGFIRINRSRREKEEIYLTSIDLIDYLPQSTELVVAILRILAITIHPYYSKWK